MSENNKITIKVKLSGEDYHDIVIDWTEETCEFHQQIYQQLAAYTGIPILYISCSWIKKGESSFSLHNTNRLWKSTTRNDSKETVRSRFNDGDCFTLRFYTRVLRDHDHLFDLNVDLIYSNDSHGNECNFFWCQHTSTRARLDKKIGILTNLELQKKIKAQLPDDFYATSDEFRRLLDNYNIKYMYFFYGSCTVLGYHRGFFPYSRHRG